MATTDRLIPAEQYAQEAAQREQKAVQEKLAKLRANPIQVSMIPKNSQIIIHSPPDMEQKTANGLILPVTVSQEQRAQVFDAKFHLIVAVGPEAYTMGYRPGQWVKLGRSLNISQDDIFLYKGVEMISLPVFEVRAIETAYEDTEDIKSLYDIQYQERIVKIAMNNAATN